MIPKTKTFLFLLCLISIAIFPLLNDLTTNVGASGEWVIDGNTVYIDDENVYLGATPHTLNRDGWVLFELETKEWDGAIDVIWGFDTPDCTPHQGQIWENYSHELTAYDWFDRVGSLIFYNVTGYIDLGIENYSLYDVTFGNENNIYLYNFTYNAGANWTIAAFTSYEEIGDGDDYELTGHYDRWESYIYYETYFDWKPWGADWEVIDYEYGGMNKWWLLENVSIVHDYRYMVRAWIDIPEQTYAGKYWWAMKPHDVSLEQSIIDETLYYLDPWWAAVFYNNSVLFEIDHDFIDEDITNFPVAVILNSSTASGCRANGEDIRFSQGAINLNYEIELWNASGDSYVWVNVSTVNASSNSTFTMYYGNDTVVDGQNKHGVWDSNFIGVYHMAEASGSVTDSTSNSRTGTTAGSLNYQRPGTVGYAIDFPRVAGDYFTLSNNMSSGVDMDVTIETYCALVPETLGSYSFVMASLRQTHCFWTRYLRTVDSMQLAYGLPPATWFTPNIEQPHTNDSIIKQYVATYDNDGSAVGYFQGENTTYETTTGNVLSRSEGNHIGYDEGTNIFKGVMDEVRYSDIPRSAAWLKASFHSFNQTTGFLSSELLTSIDVVLSDPANESTDISRKPTLFWNVTDPVYEMIWTEVYFGTNPDPPFLCKNGILPFYYNYPGSASQELAPILDNLSYNTTYYWKVHTRNEFWDEDTSDIWNFTTLENTPPNVVLSDPGNESTNITLTPTLYWNASDPSGDKIANYEIYFGTDPDPSKINQSETGWHYVDSITINHDMIDEDLTNFPLLVVINPAVGAYCDEGDSIRFNNSDNTTEFAYEIESWDSSGKSYIWVNVTSISSTVDTVIWMRYNNSDVSDAQDPTGVWDSNYAMVQHMDDETTSTILDSTSNNNDGAKKAANEPIETSGEIDGAQDFDGTDDYINCGNDASLNITDAITLAMWIKLDAYSLNPNILQKWSGNNGYALCLGSNHGKIQTYIRPGGTFSTSSSSYIQTGKWQHLSVTWNENGDNKVRVYVNGSLKETSTAISPLGSNPGTPLKLSDTTGGFTRFNGKIDEVRISDIARSSAWIKASYHNSNQTTDFLMWENTANSYTTPTLNINTTYYWKIVAWDEFDAGGTSEIWSFTTIAPWMNVTINNYYNDTLCNYNWSADVTILDAVFNANKLNTSKWYLTIVTDHAFDKTIRVSDATGEVYSLSGWGLDDKTLIYDVSLHMASHYGSLYINYNTSTYDFTARVNLQYNVSYPLSASYSNYSIFDGKNYAKAPVLNLTYYYGRFNESGNNQLVRAVELSHDFFHYEDISYLRHSSPGIYNSTDSIDPTRATIDNGALVNFSRVRLSPDTQPTYANYFVTNFEFYFDNEAPEYSEAIVSADIGIDSTGRCNITLYNVTDVTPENITVNLSVNGGTHYYENSSVYNNTNVSFLDIPLQSGINYFNYTIYDEWNMTCYYNLTYHIYLYNFVCVDEETGSYVDVSDFFGLNATIPERLWIVDLKTSGNGNFTYLSNVTVGEYPDVTHPHTIRLEIVYTEVDDGGNHITITRYYDCSLLAPGNVTRIAVPVYQPLYEQLLYSAREKPFSIYNMEAEAWVCVDYTRMAYAQAMAQYAYTINALYWLRTYNSDGTQNILVTLDGGKPTAINLDMLEYQNTTYDFTLLADGLGIKRLTNSTLQIYYFNPANDNTKAYLRLFNATQTFLYWNETVAPNEFMIFFNFSSYGLNETDVLTINITMTKTTGIMAYIQESFTLQAKGVAAVLLTAAIAAVAAIILAVFGLTLFSVRNTFAFFGPIVCGMGIAVTLLAEQIWYITLIQIVLTVLIIVQFMIYKEEYAGAIR